MIQHELRLARGIHDNQFVEILSGSVTYRRSGDSGRFGTGVTHINVPELSPKSIDSDHRGKRDARSSTQWAREHTFGLDIASGPAARAWIWMVDTRIVE